MKKVFLLLLCLVLLVSLTACKDKKDAAAADPLPENKAAAAADAAASEAAPDAGLIAGDTAAEKNDNAVPAAETPSGEAAAELPEIIDQTGKVTFGDFCFKVNGTDLTNTALAELNIYMISVKTINSKGNPGEATYTGYRLSDVLNICGIKAGKVTAIADDGYTSELDAALIDSEYTLIAIEKDNAAGKNGTIWLAPCSETVSGSYCKLVVEIKAE